MLMIMTE